MSQTAFERKYESYMAFLETRINGCPKRWYGRTRAHKALLAAGQELPLWKEVTIRCHDFRVDFCTRCYYADIPVVTLQHWMGHASLKMILEIYTIVLFFLIVYFQQIFAFSFALNSSNQTMVFQKL